MKLYRPVLIESAEQAEALPDNTMVIHPQEWPLMFVDGKLYTESETVTVEEIVEQGGYSALVPIEAEETRSEGTGWIVPTAFGPKLAGAYLGSPDGTPPKRYTQTTWRTPWEEQS